MTAPAAPPTPKEARTKTAYVVLFRAGDTTERWEVIRTVDAAKGAGEPHSYVAIPARSWKPVTVKTETTTHLTIT